jgi:hypothetical protein
MAARYPETLGAYGKVACYYAPRATVDVGRRVEFRVSDQHEPSLMRSSCFCCRERLDHRGRRRSRPARRLQHSSRCKRQPRLRPRAARARVVRAVPRSQSALARAHHAAAAVADPCARLRPDLRGRRAAAHQPDRQRRAGHPLSERCEPGHLGLLRRGLTPGVEPAVQRGRDVHRDPDHVPGHAWQPARHRRRPAVREPSRACHRASPGGRRPDCRDDIRARRRDQGVPQQHARGHRLRAARAPHRSPELRRHDPRRPRRRRVQGPDGAATANRLRRSTARRLSVGARPVPGRPHRVCGRAGQGQRVLPGGGRRRRCAVQQAARRAGTCSHRVDGARQPFSEGSQLPGLRLLPAGVGTHGH